MFVKHSNYLLNLAKVHVRLEDNTLKFYEGLNTKPAHVIKFKSSQTASFAYGRIIHGILLHWGSVDVTEHAIERLMDKNQRESIDEIENS